jgi:hypothetical protein
VRRARAARHRRRSHPLCCAGRWRRLASCSTGICDPRDSREIERERKDGCGARSGVEWTGRRARRRSINRAERARRRWSRWAPTAQRLVLPGRSLSAWHWQSRATEAKGERR